jgi:hypothetical protein
MLQLNDLPIINKPNVLIFYIHQFNSLISIFSINQFIGKSIRPIPIPYALFAGIFYFN